jgi:hypothetical protein
MHSAALIVRTEDGQPGRPIRRLQHERPVGTVLVVMLDIDPKDPLQVATANDQEPVEALGADRPDPALCVRVRLGCLHRRHWHLAAL